METTTLNPVCVYTDALYEADVKQQIQAAQKALQGLLNIWHSMDIGPCENLHKLAMNPDALYTKAIDALVSVPQAGGRFAVKREAVMASLDLPDPSVLYSFAAKVRQQPFCVSQELFSADIDGRVMLDEKEAANLIAARSIFAASPEAIKLAKDLQQFCTLANSLNRQLNGELLENNPWLSNWIRGKFKLWQKSCNTLFEISIDPAYLRAKLK